MLRTLWFMLRLLVYLICLLPLRFKAWWLKRRHRLAERRSFVGAVARKCAGALLRNGGVTLTVTGRQNLPKEGRNVIYVVNHPSFMDIPVVLAGLGGIHPLMVKHVMKRIPFLKAWMMNLDCVFVKPGNLAMQAAALRRSRDLLQSGRSLIVFPEGKRSKNRRMLPFMPAAFSLACRTGTPLVPVAIDGCDRNFDCNGWRIRNTAVTLHILPPVETAPLPPAKRRALPGQVAGSIWAVLENNANAASAPAPLRENFPHTPKAR
jgi:1-acyl-sn-glycerol-3-phosphate acyltransferase